ncbi:hypothetical protein NDU88_011353 [Pleurodeles waltl]|uniref:Uncharacterized protein n=1 Tax=Pleurodeles waltl TaxID=8319 RepID=A0AAV7S4M2_PLEWA|nr:hypothetical protein NDU88_011353 [Pleurodeles waltl]
MRVQIAEVLPPAFQAAAQATTTSDPILVIPVAWPRTAIASSPAQHIIHRIDRPKGVKEYLRAFPHGDSSSTDHVVQMSSANRGVSNGP